MIISYSVCLRDEAIAVGTLEWAYMLDGQLPYDCILSVGSEVRREPIIAECEKLFRRVTVLNSEAPPTWPQGKNATFQNLMRYADAVRLAEPIFWWEPDAIPLVKGWLTAFESEHVEGLKPFSGYIHEALWQMECVGIYPPNFLEYSPRLGMGCRAAPWDQCAGSEIVPHAHRMNHLMQFVHDINGFPPTFGEDLSLLQPGAVIFHTNKDGTLVEQLSKWKIPRATVEVIQPEPEREAFFQMGRFGDLILLLPAFKEWADRTGRPVVVFTSEHYGTVLEGVSYVEPVYLKYDWYMQAGEALAVATGRYPKVRRTQLYGSGMPTFRPDNLPSFSLTMWREAGLPNHYARLPLVFDRRDAQREEALCAGKVRPFLLVSLEGETSPLDCAAELLAMLEKTFGASVAIIETAKVNAHRVYDLLGLMDKAVGLVTIDTMTLHLAAASNVPTIHLVRDDARAGSVPKGNVACVIGYSKVQQKFDQIRKVIREMIKA